MLIAGLLAFQVVRATAVRLSPGIASLWPGHPRVLTDRVMSEIGTRAARGQTLSPQLLSEVAEIARKAPLAPEPFLIHGALAQTAHDDERAERLYLEARARDPRSMAARYFLADRYLRTGHVEPALSEMATLSRLMAGAGVFAPVLAQYARAPGAVGQLRTFFQQSPDFEGPVLEELAKDPNNLRLMLALWSGRRTSAGPGNSPPAWQTQILAKLVERGDFAQAYVAWRRFAGVEQPPGGIFNPNFLQIAAPPPFNWTLGSAGGLTEPASDGGLDVIYFGREEAVLAQQLLVLTPSRYRLAMDIKGDFKEASDIAWSMDCAPTNQVLLHLPAGGPGSASRLQVSFAVPRGCLAQRFKLSGAPGEFPKTTELTVSNLELTRVPGP